MTVPKKTSPVIDSPFSGENTPPTEIKRFSSGCFTLDLVLGGGYPEGRIIDVYGESATGKTFLAVQAVSEYLRRFPDGVVGYVDSEQTFSEDFARRVGCPVESNRLKVVSSISTLQGLYVLLDKLRTDPPAPHVMVVLDSLDALIDEEEASAGPQMSGYSVGRPKYLSVKLLPMITGMAAKKSPSVTFYVVSQARSNLNPYGPKDVRSGGRALKFYCSQILHISKTDIKETVFGKQVLVGMDIKVQVEKNKCGFFGTHVTVPVYFDRGISALRAGAIFLKDLDAVKVVEELKASKEPVDVLERRMNDACRTRWEEFLSRVRVRSESGSNEF